MNEKYDYVLGIVTNVKSAKMIFVNIEQGVFHVMLGNERIEDVRWFVVCVMDKFTMQMYSYFFTSRMSDDELEDTLMQFNEKLNLLRNLNAG